MALGMFPPIKVCQSATIPQKARCRSCFIINKDSDDDDYDTDLEQDSHKQEKKKMTLTGHQKTPFVYAKACQEVQLTPASKVFHSLDNSELNIKFQNIGPGGAKALATALVENTSVEILDLEESGLEDNLASNQLSTEAAKALSEMMRINKYISTMDISRNNFRDFDAKYIAQMIQHNPWLLELNLSYNCFSEDGGQRIGKALAKNHTLQRLDLSWNQIRRRGAVTICKALKDNRGLQHLNLSWNGFGFEGCLALCGSIKLNTTLRELDLSNNRINWDAAKFLAAGLRVNRTLKILKIGNNPLAFSGCERLLDAACQKKSAILHLGFDGIPVNHRIAYQAEVLQKSRPEFTYTLGRVHDTQELIGRELPEPTGGPLRLLFQYMSDKGIRVMDLFRVIDRAVASGVSTEQFIRGLKKINAPLTEREMRRAANEIKDPSGKITYQEILNGVKTVRANIRTEMKKRWAEEKKAKKERFQILASVDVPGNSISIEDNVSLPREPSATLLSPLVVERSRSNSLGDHGGKNLKLLKNWTSDNNYQRSMKQSLLITLVNTRNQEVPNHKHGSSKYLT
ncbi:uncharacterized protein LOC141899358 [Tubulanus polymorphus]|uniref:uncharacterized protein LOC141899358 n=1 Tax=Tubulanus polymorphus TaxID=672921 RepID=UPI003DA3EFA1